MSPRFALRRRVEHVLTGCILLSLTAGCQDSPTQPATEPALPEPTFDQVGLPADYATRFSQLYVFDRPDNRQVRVVYTNNPNVTSAPFPYGTILVMETYAAKRNAQGVVELGADGRFQRDALAGIFVMRKERFFGRRYKEHQTGEWEYASFRTDKTPNVVGDAAAAGCAVCHLDASPSRDWVYRANIRFAGGTGALPQAPANQPANAPFIDSYMFVPSRTTVKAGTRVTWTNRDQVKHTITATNAAFSGFLAQGASASLTFNTPGTYEYFCAVHPGMRGTVVVEQ
jgi:plastocyanin